MPMAEGRSRPNRRRFLQAAASLGLLTGCGRLPWQAQSPAPIPRVGLLGLRTVASLPEAFRQGLRELGYVEGQNVVVEHRVADGSLDRLAELAVELVALPVDVIVAENTPAALAARQATSTIPIVMAIGDPVRAGLAASLARPGGNVTGLTGGPEQLAGRRLEIFTEALPGVSRVAVVWNPTNPLKVRQWTETESAARTLGVQLVSMEVRAPEELDHAFAAGSPPAAEALLVFAEDLTASHAGKIVDLVAKTGLPAMYETRPFLDAGGLMAYGASAPGLFRRAAYYVDRLLKGARPEDLPIEHPREFEFVINLKAARAIGLTIPPQVLAQASEIIH
jgi:putative ABC transport system substrate-binding protein